MFFFYPHRGKNKSKNIFAHTDTHRHTVYLYTHLIYWESYSTDVINTRYENKIAVLFQNEMIEWDRCGIKTFHCGCTFIERLFVRLLYCSKQHVRAAHAIIKTRFLKLPSILTAGCWLPIMDLTLKTWQDTLCGCAEGNDYWWPLPTKLQNKLLRAPESVSHTSFTTWSDLIGCTSSKSGSWGEADSGEKTVSSSDGCQGPEMTAAAG